jgi:hypothetical protein
MLRKASTDKTAQHWFLHRQLLPASSDGCLCTVCLKFEPNATTTAVAVQRKQAQRSEQRETLIPLVDGVNSGQWCNP